MRGWAGVAAAAMVVLGGPAPALAQAEAPAAARSTVRNHVGFVEGTIGGAGPYWFLVDTGASRSALDSAVADALGLAAGGPVRVQGSAGEVEARSVRVEDLRLGGGAPLALAPTVYDLSGSLAPEGAKIAGILGFDVLKDQAVLVDVAGGRVAFAPTAEALADLAGATVVPFELDNGIPRLRAEIDGLPVELRLDTGAALGPGPTVFVNVTEAVYERLKAADPTLQPHRHFTATGTGGATLRLPVVKVARLRLGDVTVEAPQLIVQPKVGYFARPDAVGFLGAYSLAGRRFVVDYPGRRLILLP